jgi:hypothetical protein
VGNAGQQVNDLIEYISSGRTPRRTAALPPGPLPSGAYSERFFPGPPAAVGSRIEGHILARPDLAMANHQTNRSQVRTGGGPFSVGFRESRPLTVSFLLADRAEFSAFTVTEVDPHT